ncbi:glutaredoxin [Longilinea arvoryzae]|uniref:Glutaredoxin n=1 Tax=Longilinea arvoryzae TaxID=360412 RepID=A0A0S7BBB6_9CHLR|nr:glutaredoxin domain-containing protein [Longilinea arvoryzae]GAP12509.1 glutaredoxin [Longilinea arvoryzae]
MHGTTARLSRTLTFALLAAILLGLGWTTLAKAQSGDQPVVLTMFWGDGCPHCAQAKPFLEGLKAKYPSLTLDFYEVWYNEDNAKMMQQMAQEHGFEATGVPTIFIGDKYWVGFSDEIGQEIETTIQAAVAGGGSQTSNADTINVPLIGKVNLKDQSLFMSTLLISFVDGVNPCSVWVLTMLLAITLHTGSRKKVFIIGVIFLTVTSAVYMLFITGLFTVLKIVSFLGWIQVAVAMVSLLFAIVNIKDYFWYKEGLSFTIDDSKKPGIYQRMRKIMDASESFWGLAGATVVLGAGVSLVEFSCTAGFPVLWTNLLTAQKVTPLLFVALLLVYMLIYQLDEMVFFFTAVFSLKASKIEEKHGRIIKLIGGMLMLTLAIVMIVNPRWMTDLGDSLIVFGIAFAATGLVLLVHRKILPAFGIWIGTEKDGHRKGAARRQRH